MCSSQSFAEASEFMSVMAAVTCNVINPGEHIVHNRTNIAPQISGRCLAILGTLVSESVKELIKYFILT